MENKKVNNFSNLLLYCMLVGGVFVLMVFDEGLGLLATAFTYILLGSVGVVGIREKKVNWKNGLIILVAIVFLSLSLIINPNEYIRYLNMMGIFVLFAVYTHCVAKKYKYIILDKWIAPIMENIIFSFGEICVPFKMMLDKFRFPRFNDMSNKKKGTLVGLVISIPVLMIMVALLSSADQVFKDIFSLSHLNLDFLGDNDIFAKIIIWIFASTYLFAHLYLVFIKEKIDKNVNVPLMEDPLYQRKMARIEGKKEKHRAKEARVPVDPDLKETIIKTVISAMNVLFIVFTLIQFRYLFFADTMTQKGFTYSEYARRGFFELTLISVINILIMLGVNKSVTSQSGKISTALLGINTMIIAYSGVFRLNLYINIYGYTWLRVISMTFIFIQIFVILACIIGLWKKQLPLKTIIIVIYLSSYVVFSFINVDGIIVGGNVNRYFQGESLDVQHMYYQSYGIVPKLVDLYESEQVAEDPWLKGEIGKVLSNYKMSMKVDPSSWTAFNLADFRAKRILESINFD